jgi:spore germination protein YaaH
MSGTAATVTRRVAAAVVLLAAVGAIVFILYRTGFIGSSDGAGGAAAGATAQPTPTASSPPPGARRYKVCAWSRGSSASLDRAIAAGAIDEVDFDWYHSLKDGGLRSEGQKLTLVRRAQTAGVDVFATITNRLDHDAPFDGAIAAAILATPASRDAHIAKLVALCTNKGFDGIDMDWEELRAADRGRFTAFVRGLSKKLHAKGKQLSIAVYPKTSEPGDYDAQKAEDYKAIGAVVDEFKVMTYAYSGPWSKPGPQMPLSWAKQVLDFARSKVPASKVYMGLPFFGFDWQGDDAEYVLWKDVAAAKGKYGGSGGRDAASGEAIVRYSGQGGAAHTAYYQDRAAVRTKLRWMKKKEPKIAGVAIWVMGGEDPGFWQVIAAELPASR